MFLKLGEIYSWVLWVGGWGVRERAAEAGSFLLFLSVSWLARYSGQLGQEVLDWSVVSTPSLVPCWDVGIAEHWSLIH